MYIFVIDNVYVSMCKPYVGDNVKTNNNNNIFTPYSEEANGLLPMK